MDRGYIQTHTVAYVAFADGLRAEKPLYIKVDAYWRGVLRRRAVHMLDVMWIDEDGAVRARCCRAEDVRVQHVEPEETHDTVNDDSGIC